VIANAIFDNSTTERFLEIQVAKVSKFKTFEIKIFRNLKLAYLSKISVSKITSYTVALAPELLGFVVETGLCLSDPKGDRHATSLDFKVFQS